MGRIRPRRIVVEMLRQHVDEAANLRRKMVAMGIYGVDGMLRLQKLGQDRNETARFDFVDEQKARRQRETLAVHDGQPQCVVAVGLQIARNRDRLLAIRSHETPFVAPGRLGINQTIVLHEIGRLTRRTIRLESGTDMLRTARSNPSSTRSIMRSVIVKLTDTSG